MKTVLRACSIAVAVLGLCSTSDAGLVIELVTDVQLHGVIDLATDGNNLYFTPFFTNPRVGRVSVNGGTVSTLYGNLTSPLGITVVGSNLVWIDPNAGPGTGTQIFRAPKDGSGPLTSLGAGGTVDGSGITTDGTKLYTVDEVQGRVFSMNLNGGGVTQLGPNRYGGFFDTEHLNNIAVHAGTLYIADSGKPGVIAPQVVSIPTTGGAFTTLYSGTPFSQLTGIAVSDDTIFVSDAGTNTIWGLALTGGSPFEVAKDARFKHLGGLAYFQGNLYVADNGDATTGTIWRVDTNLNPSAVPEPSGVVLLCSGGLGLLGAAWRRRRKAVMIV